MLSALLLVVAGAQSPLPDTAAEEPVAYAINATLDERRHLLRATERIEYHNLAGGEVSALYLHLFPNAFRNAGTGYAREHTRLPWSSNPLDWIPWGSRRGLMLISWVRIGGRDAAFTVNETIMRVPLASALGPGGSLTIEMAFEVKLPVLQLALGFRGSSYAMALWYPRLAVADTAGWHGEREPAEAAFYADCGSYDVRITTPRGVVVAATGERADSTDGGDGTTTRRWRAEHVRYFAWVADRRYRVTRFIWNDVAVEYLHLGRADRSLNRGLTTVREALDRYGDRYGRYPHATLVIAETPALGSGVGGIAYSQLVMLPAGLRHSAIPGISYQEALAHEIAHQWWGMTVGVGETADDWLNEGFAEFSAFDLERDRADRKDWSALRRTEYLNQAGLGFDRKILQPDSAFDDMGSREVALYAKAPFVLQMLQYLVGRDVFDSLLRAYGSRHRYRTARTADFIALADSVSERDLTWFFNEWLDGTATCDYSVDAVAAAPQPGAGYRSVIRVSRRGSIVMPVELDIALEDGRVLRRAWAGREPSYQIVIDSAPAVRRVALDPDRRLLETTRFNNLYPRQVRSSFLPRLAEDDAYHILHLPVALYDDGVELGILVAGGRAPRFMPPAWVQLQHLALVAAGYNLATESVVATLAYSTPFGLLGRRASLEVSAARGGGSDVAALRLRALAGPHFYRAPYHAFTLSLERERRFETTPESDQGTITTLEAVYTLRRLVTDFYPIHGGVAAFDVEYGGRVLGSDWAFARVAARAEGYHRLLGGTKVAVHAFAGSIAWGAAPRQRALRLSREGNFRAAQFDSIAGNHLTALTGELRFPIGTGTLLEVAGFVNLGRYWGSGAEAAAGLRREVGLGLRLLDNASYAVQVDVPFWKADGTGAASLQLRSVSFRIGRPFRGPGS